MPSLLPKSTLTILIADDTDTDRMILESIVGHDGHNIISVSDGMQAVEAYRTHQPDLILMDALMPNMDGFEAAKHIRALAKDRLLAIIFLTSLTDTESLVQCYEAGGDDFLAKPYNRIILSSKIKSFQRVYELHREVQLQRDQISRHNDHLIHEQDVAKYVFDNIAHTGCLDASNVKYCLSPLAIFNGDVMVAGMRPTGNMMVLLGDFTGHGLPAAIGAMPLATCFYGMVGKGFSMEDILREINRKLIQVLPTGVFCCATILDMNFTDRKVKVWNGGLPDCYIHRANTGEVHTIASTHLPLGILEDARFNTDCVRMELDLGDKVYLWSDGIVESKNKRDEMFGEQRLRRIFDNAEPDSSLFDQILENVNQFCGGDRDDDLSLIEITMVEAGTLLADSGEGQNHRYSGMMDWSFSLQLQPSTFRLFDPLPLLVNILVEVPGLRSHSGTLYTVLAELYSNALEHGILGLSSSWKETPEGFARYYQERQQRLEKTYEGQIDIHLSHQLLADGGELSIHIIDSGPGFDYVAKEQSLKANSGFCGRGIALLKTLCRSVEYAGKGNEVKAVFGWSSND